VRGQAILLYKMTLASRERVPRPSHPPTLASRNDIEGHGRKLLDDELHYSPGPKWWPTEHSPTVDLVAQAI